MTGTASDGLDPEYVAARAKLDAVVHNDRRRGLRDGTADYLEGRMYGSAFAPDKMTNEEFGELTDKYLDGYFEGWRRFR